MKTQLIISDCDGVFLDFSKSMADWASEKHGLEEVCKVSYSMSDRFGISHGDELIEEFIATHVDGELEPIYSSIEPVKKLYNDYGIQQIIVTAIDDFITEGRTRNLKKYFGDAIKEVHCVGSSANKATVLKKYEGSGCLWIEDWVANAYVGKELGLDAVIYSQPWNQDYGGKLPVFNNMEQIVSYYHANVRNIQ